jgi:hypothetical protein
LFFFYFSVEKEADVVVSESSQNLVSEEESNFISSGSYSYTTPDGRLIGLVTVSWIANEARLHTAEDHKPSTSLNQLPENVAQMLAEFEAAADAVSVVSKISTEVSPVESSPAENSPVESSPAETSPVESSSAVESAGAVESNAIDASSSVSSPAESSPVESSPVESTDSISA